MSASGSEDGLLAALREAHDFPDRYTFKVIGENTDVFTARAIEVVRLAIPNRLPTTTARQSRGGKVQSITLVVEVPSAEVAVAIHRGLGRIPGAKMVL